MNRQTIELETVGHFIGGKHVCPVSAQSAPVFNPATGAISAQVLTGGKTEVDLAVAAAHAAAPAWSE
ncbi:aldehyde dehydrogenase family protein, partial [Klebsiella variicola]|uniref:aldehyde dehydrogenase family protein n=1 Tax=Klebsiella variicola TaxID=244366 RepID=UPI000E28A158